MNFSVGINNVTKVFGRLTDLKGITLQVGAGEVFAYIGPNTITH